MKTGAGPTEASTSAVDKGLTAEEVQEKLRQFGYNEITERRESRVIAFIRKFWGITPWMLEITIGLELLLGKYVEACVVAGLLVFNAILGFTQEERANAALESLKERLKISARARRDGNWAVIPARELVPGDIIRLRAGDFVPADVRIVEGQVDVDQSSLTGESQMIKKNEGEILYSGAVAKRGEITGMVTGTGTSTYFGKTVELVQVAKPKLHMEEVTSRVVRWLVVIVASFLLVALVFTAARGLSLFEILPLTVVLLVSAIPVALPTMFAISMAFGSVQLIKKGILITRLSAIEDAATMTIVCADKTGTMTTNRLSVAEVLPAGSYSKSDVLLYGALASVSANQDAIDLAFIAGAKDSGLPLEGYRQEGFVPFDAATRRTQATIRKDGETFVVQKGATNTVLALAKNGPAGFPDLLQGIDALSAKGYRAITVAKGVPGDDVDIVGVGFLYDKLRPDSTRLVLELKALGLIVKMLTGDALPIAREVAAQLGLGSTIIRTADLKKNSEEQMAMQIEQSDGFAEIYPEDKYLIVKSLQKANHMVGMTGDGVNDAPALRQAEVGIAVSSATDVAKKAAGAVLTTEGLEGIVDLVKIGRATYQRIITWILNKIIKTFQITVFVVLAFLLTGQYVISALHMILLLFLTDFVTLSISTDNVRYSAKPDTWNITGLVKVALFLGIIVIGELMLLLHAGDLLFRLFGDIGRLQTFTFEMLIFVELLDVLIIRERRHFWNSRPSNFLLIAIGIDLLLVFFLSALGLPGIAPIGFVAAATVPTLSFLLVFVINDQIKARLIRMFWGRI